MSVQKRKDKPSNWFSDNPLLESKIAKRVTTVGRMNYRRAEGRRQSRIVEKTKDVEREDLWRFVMNNDLISLFIDNRLY
jgi:hypothetical protein